MKSLATSRFHPIRVAGRKAAAEILAAAQAAVHSRGDDAVTFRCIGRRWGNPKPISHRAIGALFDSRTGKAIAFGDVLALPKELAREVLMRAFASLDGDAGPGTRDTLDAIAIDLGVALDAYRKDLAKDGREDEHATHGSNLLRIATLAMRGYLNTQRKAGA